MTRVRRTPAPSVVGMPRTSRSTRRTEGTTMEGVAIVRCEKAKEAVAAEWTRSARRESLLMSFLLDIFLLCPRHRLGQGACNDAGQSCFGAHVDDVAVCNDEPIEVPL